MVKDEGCKRCWIVPEIENSFRECKAAKVFEKECAVPSKTLFKNNKSTLYNELNGISQDRNNPAPVLEWHLVGGWKT